MGRAGAVVPAPEAPDWDHPSPNRHSGLAHRGAHGAAVRFRSARRWGRASQQAVAVLAAAVLFTTVGTALLSRSAKETDSRNADLVTLRLSSDLQRLVSAHSALIAGLRSLYRLNQELSPEQFRDFVAGSGLLDAYPGAQALEFARRSPARPDARTPPPDGLQPLMNVVGTGDPDVPARPGPAAGDAWVVEYVEPVSGNEAALGLDLVAETARREAIEEACRLNRPAATSPIRLVQDRSSATGFVVVAPVYQSDPAPMTPEARYEQCTGVMVVVYRASEVLSMVTAEEAAEFEVYDVGPLAAVAGSEPPRLDSLLFDTDGKSAAGGRPVNGTHPRGEIDFHGGGRSSSPTSAQAGAAWLRQSGRLRPSVCLSRRWSPVSLCSSRRRGVAPLARGRLVAAGDSDRRSWERDLHDGAQQRLLAASLALRRAHAACARR